MQRDPVPSFDGLEVNLLDHRLVVSDDGIVDVHAEIALGLQHRDPQPALHDHLGLRGPDAAHRVGGVPVGEHVPDLGHGR